MYFDALLTWKEHVGQVEDKCKKVLNVMRCLTGVEWGADTASLRCIYVALIRSRLDYGSVAYGSAAKSVLAGLDRIQTQGLHRNTPVGETNL